MERNNLKKEHVFHCLEVFLVIYSLIDLAYGSYEELTRNSSFWVVYMSLILIPFVLKRAIKSYRWNLFFYYWFIIALSSMNNIKIYEGFSQSAPTLIINLLFVIFIFTESMVASDSLQRRWFDDYQETTAFNILKRVVVYYVLANILFGVTIKVANSTQDSAFSVVLTLMLFSLVNLSLGIFVMLAFKFFAKSLRLFEKFRMREFKNTDVEDFSPLLFGLLESQGYDEEKIKSFGIYRRPTEIWKSSFDDAIVSVVVKGKIIVGFGKINSKGELDELAVHKHYQKKGIGKMICDDLESKHQGKIKALASDSARPYLEKRGYKFKRELFGPEHKLKKYLLIKTNYSKKR